MGVFRQFPYSNFHEMNMDEIIKIIKNMLDEWATYHAEWDAWMAQMNDDWSNYQEVMNEAWQNMQDFINNYFDNLDVQEEINNKINDMVEAGEFGAIVAPYIPTHVTEWLTTHITQPVGVVIDTSLTVAGACADAKATGDAINEVKSALDNLYIDVTLEHFENVLEIIDTSGAIGSTVDTTLASSANYNSILYECKKGDIFIVTGTGGSAPRLWAFLDTNKVLLSHADESASGINLKLIAEQDGYFVANYNRNLTHNIRISVPSDQFKTIDYFEWEQGGVNASGQLTDSTTRIRTKKLELSDTLAFSATENFQCVYVYYFDASETYIKRVYYIDKNIVIPNYEKYVIIVCGADDNTQDVTPSDTNYLVRYNAEIISNDINFIRLEQGSINTAGVESTNRTRLKTRDIIYGKPLRIVCPNGFQVFRAFFYDEYGSFDSFEDVYHISYDMDPTKRTKLVFSKTDTSAEITVDEIQRYLFIHNFDERLDNLDIYLPEVEFEYDHDFYDIEATGTPTYTGGSTAMEQIYQLFDSLVTNHSDYVSKVDAATVAELEYPAYASTYRTYMYELKYTNSNVNTDICKRKKVFIVAGVHGDETAAIYDTFLFAYRLCNDYMSDPNFFKLRSMFDFYIIPCLNGKGIIDQTRQNGNGVNINRNFPTSQWTEEGEPFDYDYSGPSPMSEFETKIVCYLTESLEPDVCIDHHNYTYNLNWQFYVDAKDIPLARVTYRSLVDCSYAFKKNLPTYFGSNFDLLVHRYGTSPAIISDLSPTTVGYWKEKDIPVCATVEVSNTINYWNGDYYPGGAESFGINTKKVNEYTFRNITTRFCEQSL